VTPVLRIKIIQLAVNDSETKADRLLRVEKILEQTAAEKNQLQLIMLPEIWGTGFFNFDRYRQESELLEGETFTRLAPWAEKLGSYLLAGSIVEREADCYYNSTLLIGPNGALCGCYRKIHLFGYQSAESKILAAGSEIYILKNKYGTWGFSTCYDLRFPELYRKMSDSEVDTIFVVAAWPLARLEHWLILNRSRALENLAFLVACNCAGGVGDRKYAGNSLVVSPWGDLLACGGLEEEELTITINPQETTRIRAEFPALQDRKIR
jgi:predicted amidohydrolase